MKRLSIVTLLLVYSFCCKSQTITEHIPVSEFKLVRANTLDSSIQQHIAIANTVAANSLFSNITNFTGYAFYGARTVQVNGNAVTDMIADDITMVAKDNYSLNSIKCSIANLNFTTVTARIFIRFYLDNAGPSNLIASFNFDASSFQPRAVSILSYNLPTPFNLAQKKIWAGIYFDNNNYTTGATIDELNLLGQGIYNPVDQGSSNDVFFSALLEGPYNANNPEGYTFNYSGSPIANAGWELIGNTPLPIILTAFSASKNGKTNLLSWSTGQEIKSSRFVVERSADGTSYKNIGSVTAQANSYAKYNYNYTDYFPEASMCFYRLKMLDEDGSFAYSKIVSVSTDVVSIGIYPNPTKGIVNIQVHDAKLINSKINLFDNAGKLIRSFLLTDYQQKLSTNLLANGIYTLVFSDGVKRTFIKE